MKRIMLKQNIFTNFEIKRNLLQKALTLIASGSTVQIFGAQAYPPRSQSIVATELTSGVTSVPPPQLTTQNQQIRPYLQVTTVASEENTVRVFFSPNCPYSASYFDFFVNLSKTLPKELRFELSALPNTKDSAAYALSYLAVRRYFPTHLKQFVQASFVACQTQGLSSKNWGVIQKIATSSHISVSLPSTVLKNKNILTEDLTDLIDLCKALKVTNTPCVSVDGTYSVTPEFVPGADPTMFNQLVNSIISMSLGA